MTIEQVTPVYCSPATGARFTARTVHGPAPSSPLNST